MTELLLPLDLISWPDTKIGEAIEVLARKSGFPVRRVDVPAPPSSIAHGTAIDAFLGRWIDAVARWLKLEAKRVQVSYSDVEQSLRCAAPALFRVRFESESGFVVLLRTRRQAVAVLGLDLATHWLPLKDLVHFLRQSAEVSVIDEVNGLLDAAGVRPSRREQTRATLLREWLGTRCVGECWLLRPAVNASFLQEVRDTRVPRWCALFLGAHILESGLGLAAWWLVGRGALQGRLDRGLLLAWFLMLLTLIPFHLLTSYASGLLAIDLGGLIKKRLLIGTLHLESDEVRHCGVGQLLGRVIESQAVESLVLSGGLLGITSLVELAMAGGVLAAMGNYLPLVFLIGWTVVGFLLGRRYLRSQQGWAETRLDLTNDLIERMIGHRTRLAQEPRDRWHESEDQSIKHYFAVSRQMDQDLTVLTVLIPRGWLLLGMIGLAPTFAAGRGFAPALAVALGAVMMASGALRKLTGSTMHLTGVAIAWKQIAPLFRAAKRAAEDLDLVGSPAVTVVQPRQSVSKNTNSPVIEVRHLTFRYRGRAQAVLQDVNLQMYPGERVLLEGRSGSGKSTLGAILTGLRLPESGLLLLQGLDRNTLGPEGWCRRVVAAPQFHENHILSGTFSFNLLMGRGWPAQQEDLQEAEQVCRELGLGELLDRMPSGLQQMLGETGWQLSHGERSRLYIARALLHRADLVVLDESFAALDPETLHHVLHCVLTRAPTVLVIAHP